MNGSMDSRVSKKMSDARLRVFRNFVSDLTTLSKCEDKKVACIVTDEEGSQVYAIGVNGGAKGGPDCLCKLDGSRYTCVHAEANALAKCIAAGPKVLISNFSCCVTCAALMVNSGVTQFYYAEEYKSKAGIDILVNAGVYVKNISDEARHKDWVDNIIDCLRVNHFIKLSRENIKDWVELEARITGACCEFGYTMFVNITGSEIIIEWREPR